MTGLIDRLPQVRGRYTENAALDRITWFRVGGPAEVMFRPADAGDLAGFLKDKPDDVSVTVMGVGSNLLIRDGGVRGVVIRLGRGFATIDAEGGTVRAGAAALDVNVAAVAADCGIAGLEFLSGIPGTIGGALRMNAGAFGSEMAAVVAGAKALDPSGNLHDLTLDDLGFGYRESKVSEHWIFVEALLRGRPDDPAEIRRRMAGVREERERNQPLGTATGGSTFRNPPDLSAWKLIDRAGCRGLRIGGAMVSEKHCNFLVNTGDATAADLEALGEEVRRRVSEDSGVQLQWEIRRLGEPAREGGA